MSEGGGWSWIGQIISWHVNSLDRCDGSFFSGGNSLLQDSQIGGQSRLIPDGGWDTSQKGGDFRTSLGEPEDVVNEKKHVFPLFVSEILSDRESGESDSGSCAWRFVHLTVDQSAFGGAVFETDNSGFYHFVIQIISLSGSFSDSSEDGIPSVSLCHVVDQLLNKHGFSDSCSSEKPDFSSS